jgi:heme ABC exporter ATP-binding subunit CcmA
MVSPGAGRPGRIVVNWVPMRASPRAPGLATATAAVDLVGVTRLFGAVPALVRADLRVERGETVVLRGPNGAGKTTLLRIVATSLSPTYGGGAVLGHDLVRERHPIRHRTELLTHRTRLYDDLTAHENLRFWCRLLELEEAGIDAALDRVGLLEVAGERVRGFSQGMRQRLAIARTQLRRPELLLLDEPYTGLDAEARHAVDDLVREGARQGRTTIVATHHPVPEGLAHRTLHLDGGRIVREAP